MRGCVPAYMCVLCVVYVCDVCMCVRACMHVVWHVNVFVCGSYLVT